MFMKKLKIKKYKHLYFKNRCIIEDLLNYVYLSFVKLKKYDIINMAKGTGLYQFLKILYRISLFVKI